MLFCVYQTIGAFLLLKILLRYCFKSKVRLQAVLIQKKIEQTDYEVARFIMVRNDRVFDKNNLFE